MEKLILVRHGNYNGSVISDSGRQQMEILARKLQLELQDKRVLIISSTALRAIGSAEVFSNVLGISFEQDEKLWSDNDHWRDHSQLLELIRARQEDADVIILVTHLEYTEEFPAYYGKEELKVNWNQREIEKGEAWIIDCIKKTLLHITR